jgi:hypothetical protein
MRRPSSSTSKMSGLAREALARRGCCFGAPVKSLAAAIVHLRHAALLLIVAGGVHEGLYFHGFQLSLKRIQERRRRFRGESTSSLSGLCRTVRAGKFVGAWSAKNSSVITLRSHRWPSSSSSRLCQTRSTENSISSSSVGNGAVARVLGAL